MHPDTEHYNAAQSADFRVVCEHLAEIDRARSPKPGIARLRVGGGRLHRGRVGVGARVHGGVDRDGHASGGADPPATSGEASGVSQATTWGSRRGRAHPGAAADTNDRPSGRVSVT